MKYATLDKAYQNREERINAELFADHVANLASYNGDIEHLKEGWQAPASPIKRKAQAPASLTSRAFSVSSVADEFTFDDTEKTADVDADFSDLSLTGRDDQ